MCTYSIQCSPTDTFDPTLTTGNLNSAIFRKDVVEGLLKEASQTDIIEVETHSFPYSDTTLIMRRLNYQGQPIANSSIISAAFPCPQECTSNKNLKIRNSLDRKFCQNHIRAIFQISGVTGLAFHLLNSDNALGMYGVIIDTSGAHQHTRYNLTNVANPKVYKAQ